MIGASSDLQEINMMDCDHLILEEIMTLSDDSWRTTGKMQRKC